MQQTDTIATPGKRAHNRRTRKEALYQAAVELFRSQGFDETTVEEIAQAAGLAKGTFFNYFPSKEDILLHIGERHVSRLGAGLAQEESAGRPARSSAIGDLKRLLHALAASLQADRDLVCLALDKALKMSYLAPTPRGGWLNFRGLVALLISRAQRNGEIHPDLDPEPLASILEGLYYQQLALWCQQGFAFDLGDRLEQVIDLLLIGIGPRTP